MMISTINDDNFIQIEILLKKSWAHVFQVHLNGICFKDDFQSVLRSLRT